MPWIVTLLRYVFQATQPVVIKPLKVGPPGGVHVTAAAVQDVREGLLPAPGHRHRRPGPVQDRLSGVGRVRQTLPGHGGLADAARERLPR